MPVSLSLRTCKRLKMLFLHITFTHDNIPSYCNSLIEVHLRILVARNFILVSKGLEFHGHENKVCR